MNAFNYTYKEETHYKLLKVLNENPNVSQREISKKMGVSLGKVNFCISELSKKGFLKIRNFKNAEKKIKYIYNLTPKGIEEKAKITFRFLKKKMKEFEEIKSQIDDLKKEVNRLRSLNN